MATPQLVTIPTFGGSAQFPVYVTVVEASPNNVLTYSAQGGTSAALLTATAVQVGATGARSLYAFDFLNSGASVAYIQIFDAVAANVTLGTTVPKLVKPVPAGYSSWQESYSVGTQIAFTNGITVAATTTPTGNTAPATGINANFNYA